MNVEKLMREYQGVQVDSAVAEADSHKLISMLMNGALDKLVTAKASDDLAIRKALVSKAISIVEYLRVSLDPGADLEFSTQLGELYSYMELQLLKSTLESSEVPLDEVIGLLRPVRDGWDAMQAEYRS
jgi:flagellar protein FliS